MLDQVAGHPLPLIRLPRHVPGEWLCVDCHHLSYGFSQTPRCPNCQGSRLRPTVADRAASQRRREPAALEQRTSS